jgi:hypothetical protein
VHVGRYEKRVWKVCEKQCPSSKYLEDLKVEHDILGSYDFKIIRRVRFWNKMVGNMELEEHLEERLGHQISGMWLCNIL